MSGIRLEITKDGKLLNAFIAGKPLKDDQLYPVANIDYLSDGNGRMDAFLQAEKRVCPEDATSVSYTHLNKAAPIKLTIQMIYFLITFLFNLIHILFHHPLHLKSVDFPPP